MSFSLQPGERRGWWSGTQESSGRAGIALVHGAVCDYRTRILLDSGASTSILSLKLASELGLKLSFEDKLKVKGLGDVVSHITAKTKVKVTLGMSVVYYMDIWCGNIGEGTDCLLGMDFMTAAGVRLSAHEGTVRLPNEESVPLLASGQRPRLPMQITVRNNQEAYVQPGAAIVVPKPTASRPPDLRLWVCRGDWWLTTVVPQGIRVVNISDTMRHLPERTPVAYLMEQGHLPDGARCVSPTSNKYDEWQVEINNVRSSPDHERDKAEEVDRYNASLPPAVERPQYATPRRIQARPRVDQGRDTILLAESLKDPDDPVVSRDSADPVTPEVEDSRLSVKAWGGRAQKPEPPHAPIEPKPMTMKVVQVSALPLEPEADRRKEASRQVEVCYRALLATEPEREVAEDSLEYDAEVNFHEGVDHIVLESLKDQLTMLPELSGVVEPINLQSADVGEPENTVEEMLQIREILEKHQSVFISSGNALPPPARGVVCDIEVEPGTKPIAQRMRRIPGNQLSQVAELLKNLLGTGIIEFSQSRWASPIVIVMKKNGVDIRLCIDYRRVNQLINLMSYPLPLIDELLDNFDKTMWFLSLDMASGFWAVQMTQRAKEISAFLCPLGHFQWVRMPFGLKNAPLVYQQVIDNCLWGYVRLPPDLEAEVEPEVLTGVGLPTISGPRVSPREGPVDKTVFELNIPAPMNMGPVLGRSSYIDDIAYGDKTWKGLCEALDRLLYRLRYWRISVSLPKSSFGKKAIPYLSHEINRFGIKAVPKIVKGIDQLEFPTSLKGCNRSWVV